MNRVMDGPVARAADPITSFEAGENPFARQRSEQVVLAALSSIDGPASDFEIESWVAIHRPELQLTSQRLRTARRQLEKKRVVVSAGIADRRSSTGRRALVWKMTERAA